MRGGASLPSRFIAKSIGLTDYLDSPDIAAHCQGIIGRLCPLASVTERRVSAPAYAGISVMPVYQFYRDRKANHIGEPPEHFKFPDDAAAIRKANQLLDGHDIEIWRGALIVGRLKSKD